MKEQEKKRKVCEFRNRESKRFNWPQNFKTFLYFPALFCAVAISKPFWRIRSKIAPASTVEISLVPDPVPSLLPTGRLKFPSTTVTSFQFFFVAAKLFTLIFGMFYLEKKRHVDHSSMWPTWLQQIISRKHFHKLICSCRSSPTRARSPSIPCEPSNLIFVLFLLLIG
jgi:hypothetical protein